MRALQRMGEEIADDQLPRLAELAARLEREFALLSSAPAPAAPAPAEPIAPEALDAAHR